MFDWLKRNVGKQAAAPDPALAPLPGIFLEGAYRLHRAEDVERYTALAIAAFPDFAKRIRCFGSTWLGCQVATDEGRVVAGEPQILLLEPGTGEALEIPCGLSTFHTGELMTHPDAIAATSFLDKWRSAGGATPGYDQCVGYRTPLYLSGEDDVANLVMSDFEVYWGVSAQLLEKVRGLPVGTRIADITMR